MNFSLVVTFLIAISEAVGAVGSALSTVSVPPLKQLNGEELPAVAVESKNLNYLQNETPRYIMLDGLYGSVS